jgi:hypothetical protein
VKGYRVRLGVLEEYEVAVLAESADEVKARAEADTRRAARSKTSRTVAGRGRFGRGAGCRAVPGTRVEGA